MGAKIGETEVGTTRAGPGFGGVGTAAAVEFGRRVGGWIKSPGSPKNRRQREKREGKERKEQYGQSGKREECQTYRDDIPTNTQRNPLFSLRVSAGVPWRYEDNR